MAATMLGSLLVSLGLESANFDKGLDKSRKNFRRAAKDFETTGDKMERLGFKIGSSLKVLGGTAIAAGLAVITTQLTRLVTTSLEYAGSLEEQAQQLGVTTDALQEYRHVAGQVGLTAEEMDQALAQLTRRIGEAAQGTKAQAEAFKALGITVKDTNGNVLNAADAIPKIADALKKVESPAQRAAILTDLFGKAGQKLEPLLAGGSAAVNELRAAAHKLGIVLSEKQIQNADRTADKLAALKDVLQARIAGVVADNADSIYRLANSLANLIDKALKAAGAWLKFRGAMNTQGEQYARADAYLAGRKDLTDSQRKIAQARARKVIDSKLGLETKTTSYLGGLIKVRKTDYKKRPRGQMADGTLPPSSGPAPAAVLGDPDLSASGGGGGSRGSKGGASGPTAAEITRRFNDELAGYAQQVLSARQSMAMSVEEAAEYELRGVELARLRTIDGIQAEKDYSATQKKRLVQEVEALAEQERARIDFEKRRQLEDQRREIEQQEYAAQRDALQMQMEMADTDQERQNIAMQLLGLDQQFRRNALEQIIASDVRTDAEKALAQNALDQLARNEALEATATARQNETRAQAYMRSLNKSGDQINEAIDDIKINGLERLNDALVDSIMNFKSLASVARNVVQSVLAELLRLQIQQAIIKPLAAAIGLPGFASGTNFAPGGLALVGERGPELVNLPRGSQVIPNHELGGLGMRREVHSPTFVFPGVTNERMAREAAGQAARRYRADINGPLRRIS